MPRSDAGRSMTPAERDRIRDAVARVAGHRRPRPGERRPETLDERAARAALALRIFRSEGWER